MTGTGAPTRAWGRWIAIVAGGVLGAGFALLVPRDGSDAPPPPRPDTIGLRRTGDAPRAISLGGIQLRDTSGAVVPIARPGEPAIVMARRDPLPKSAGRR